MHTIIIGNSRYYSMSYVQSLYHVVFRTYASELTIDERFERDLYAYLFTVAQNQNVHVYRIGGMPDHIHMLVDLPSTLAIASFVQHIKTVSSKWLSTNPAFPHFRGWAKEYAALSYSLREKDMIVNYIKGQKEHHKKVSFEQEYRQFLLEYGVSIREDYWLKD